MENWGFCTNQSNSTRPVKWVTGPVIGAWQVGAERPSFHGNQACYHGNRHRYHGKLGRNGNHGRSKYGVPPSEGGAGLKPVVLNTPGRGGVDNTTFYDKSFYHMFGKHVKLRGSSVLRYRDIMIIILYFVRTVIFYIFKI